MHSRHLIPVVLLALLLARTSSAQVSGREPRPSDRTAQQVSLRATTLAGYGDNLASLTSGLLPYPSGYTSTSEATLTYSIGRVSRSLEVSGRGLVNAYPNTGVRPGYGAGLDLRGRTIIGRRNELAGFQSAQYDPFFPLGALGGLGSDAGTGVSDPNPANALTDRRLFTTNSAVSFMRHWTRRTTTDLRYSLVRQTFVDSIGSDGRTHAGSLAIDSALGRNGGVRATFQQQNGRFVESDGEAFPTRSRMVDFGFRYGRALSRARRISFAGGIGAAQVDTIDVFTGEPFQRAMPSGYGTVSVDLGRTWAIAADYRRSTFMLHGSTSSEPFIAHEATIRAGGPLAPRLQGNVTASYSNGLTVREQGEGSGQYDLYRGTAHVEFRLTPWWSAVVRVSHYRYQANSVGSRSLGILSAMHRNAVTAGFTWVFPPEAAPARRRARSAERN
jgi:hypothetical protein